MKIYTKHGDQGETALFGGTRVPKDHLRIQAYGTLDELNASIGMAVTEMESHLVEVSALHPELIRIQGEIFQLGAELATPNGIKVSTALLGSEATRALEMSIDRMEAGLPALQTFILPGGTKLSATLHLARTICRRAERELVILHHSETMRPGALEYLNRLSDYLFVASRHANFSAKVADRPWIAPGPAAK
ncbi:MAG: cob(I)yrinic acid a,c-diamide adenosyltransferase [Cryobacterium sp.]|nr:cob(I)yrinic acid a,c-diamide adenosyltransferase [Oligoflexia bacterium]